jgi:outer membrane protein OmpA-like peptidoglycan-associated protein
MNTSSRFAPPWARGLTLVTALFLPSLAAAQDYDVKVFKGRAPTTRELIESLKPEQPAEGMKFRGVRPVEATKPRAVSLMVQFEFGSAELTPDARKVLNNVGAALQSPDLSANGFVIEGHTDSVGSDDYNQRLSEARAKAVKEYLILNFHVDPSRLESVGKGEAQPLDRDHPDSGVNRRVQIVTVR